jgi:hypothetical protein
VSTSGKDEFLVTTTVQGKTWQVVWDPETAGTEQPKPLGLDHPVFWELHNTRAGFILKHTKDGYAISIADGVIARGEQIPLPHRKGEPRDVTVQLKRLKKIRPAFITDFNAFKNIGPADNYASSGIRDLLINFEQVNGTFDASVEKVPIFKLKAVKNGFHLTAFQKNLRFKILGQKSRLVPIGQPIILTTAEVHGGAFILGSYWWRINKVAKPSVLDAQDFADEEKVQEAVPLNVLGKIVAGIFVGFLLISRSSYYLERFQESKRPKVIQAQVELKKPKIIPIEIAKRPEPPKPIEPLKLKEEKKQPPKVVVKKEPPKPKKKEVAQKRPVKMKEPPKVAKKEPPKKPAPVIAKNTPPPPPKMVAKKEPPKPVAPAPLARAAPVVKTPPKAVAQVPNPAVQIAKQKAQEKAALAKSLNFLSSAPSKNVAAFATVPGAAVSAKYQDLGAGAVSGTSKGGASALNKMADNTGGDGTIATRGARSVAGVGLAGAHGKGLNEVQGKVSLSALYGNGSGEELASAAGAGGGISVSGPGKISDAEIEKTLAKYLQKFQYCYEKALLTDSTLAGTIQMQWTIQVGGAVSDSKVVRSAMSNAGLHTCLTRELSKIVFPSPRGGSVVVKKPFSFQSTTM